MCGTVSFCLEIACLGVLELNFSASGEAAPAAEAQNQFSLYVMKVLRYLGAALCLYPSTYFTNRCSTQVWLKC